MASTSPQAPQPEFRLLLDQGFPKPPGFDVRAVDHTISVEHLSDFKPELARVSTPDWLVYLEAKRAGFEAMVTRDLSQIEQDAEMYVLSRLSSFTIITWKKAIEDPVKEWGQMLAYLPEVKRRLASRGKTDGRIILLPAPTLSGQNFKEPREWLGVSARQQGVSNKQIRDQAKAETRDWLEMSGRDPDEFNELLGH